MGNLPTELLIQVSHHLHPIDRMECMLVCRHWKETIENSTLYHTVVILTGSVLEKFLDRLEKHPHITDMVRNIVIHGIDEGSRLLHEVLPRFTKLRLLDCAIEKYSSNGSQVRYPCHELIETLVDYDYGAPCTCIMLSSGICNNLPTLNTVTTGDNIIITLLRNAPNLKNLTLRDGRVHFNELNTLHSNAPNLTTFNLINIYVAGAVFQEDIIDPATSLVQFTFNHLNMELSQSQPMATLRESLLVYIAKKYSNLSWLNCSIAFDGTGIDNQGLREPAINNGWISLITTMGSRLGTLSLRLRKRGSEFFEALDRSACQVHHLTLRECDNVIFTVFPQSRQIHHIQTLVLHDVSVQTYEWIKELKVLRELVLSSAIHRVQFSIILDSVPHTLKSLTIRNCYLSVDRNCSESSHIQALTLSYIHCPEQLDNFITRHFPILSSLKLEQCHFKEKTFDLPNANLLVFQFTKFLLTKSFTVLIKSCSDNNSRMYLFNTNRSVRIFKYLSYGHSYSYHHNYNAHQYRDRKDRLVVMDEYITYGCPYKSYPASERNEEPDLTFSFNSVKNLLFNKE